MNNSIRFILKEFPKVEKAFLSNQEEDTKILDTDEKIILDLVNFFDNPREKEFNLGSIFNNLNSIYLPSVLESIYLFFKKDTYLLPEESFSFISAENEFLNQSDFVNFLDERFDLHGKNFSRAMFNTYLKRGNIPDPDLVISNNKYWTKETAKNYVSSLKK